MNKLVSFTLLGLSLFCLRCKETIITGLESLTDPNIKPKIIFTNPPSNSRGPYDDDPGQGYSLVGRSEFEIIVRFNKIMSLSTLKAAMHLSSLSDDTPIPIDLYTITGDIIRIIALTADRINTYKLNEFKKVYELNIDSTAKDINGNSLIPAFTMTFEPEPYFRVRSVFPSNGAIMDPTYDGYLELQFNSKLDNSIFRSLSISPAFPSITWRIYDSTQVYTSLGVLDVGTTYTVSVNKNAHDIEGNYLQEPFTSSFSTVPFGVIKTIPADRSLNIPLYQNITVYMTGVIDTSTLRSAFQATPKIDGNFTTYSPLTSFIFTPIDDLQPETTYVVTIDTTIKTKNGSRLPTPYSFRFTTAPFKVLQTNPLDGAVNVSRNTPITFVFTGRIDPNTVRFAFGITGGVTGGLRYFDYDFVFTPNNPLAANTMYTVILTTSLRSRGGINLSSPYTFSFTTGN